ncbi:MAG: hypothetical protein RLZZ603_1580 [Actinomycetota bacterium]|jgi:uncharacterized membrane protein YczE
MPKPKPVALAKLFGGLYIFGFGIALMVHAAIGLGPWDIFAQGFSRVLHISYGWASVIVSIIVLLCWIPLKQRPGFGTVMNAVLIGLFADTVFPILPPLNAYWQQLGMFILGMLLLALATGLYISANYGMGPRDGLMVGTARVSGWAIWKVRTGYELIVMSIGWAMGGQLREGTLIFALCIGPLMQISLKLFGVKSHRPVEEA